MAASGYTAWSVTAGEVPTASKWSLLGQNDASFNTGNGFNDAILQSRHFANNSVPGSALGVQAILYAGPASAPTVTASTWNALSTSGWWQRVNSGSTAYVLSGQYIQVPYTGIYEVTWHAAFGGTVADASQNLVAVSINSTTTQNLPWTRTYAGAGGTLAVEQRIPVAANSGDKITLWVWPSTTTMGGGALQGSGLPPSGDTSYVYIRYVGTQA